MGSALKQADVRLQLSSWALDGNDVLFATKSLRQFSVVFNTKVFCSLGLHLVFAEMHEHVGAHQHSSGRMAWTGAWVVTVGQGFVAI